MHRRQVLTTVLGGLGLAAVGISAREARAQRSGTRPIGTASAMTARGLMVTRVYPGANRRNLILMIRTVHGDRWHSITLPAGYQQAFRAAQSQTEFRIEIGPQGCNALCNNEVITSLVAGGTHLDFTILGEDGVQTVGTATGEPVPTSQALGFFGALVAIVGMLVGLAALAMITGTSLSTRLKWRGIELDIEVGNGEDMPPDNGGSGFMHDPICDTLPPMNC